jgi:hypothetical protein
MIEFIVGFLISFVITYGIGKLADDLKWLGDHNGG